MASPDITDAAHPIATRPIGESLWIRAKSATHTGSFSRGADLLDAVPSLIRCSRQPGPLIYYFSAEFVLDFLPIDQAAPGMSVLQHLHMRAHVGRPPESLSTTLSSGASGSHGAVPRVLDKGKMWARSTYDPYFQRFSSQRVLESRRSSGHRITKIPC
jgi:hypothetical protein